MAHSAGAAGLAVLALVAASPVLGCGHCVEDRIAAVYDHGVIAQALERNHRMAFFALEGPLPRGRESRHLVAAALASSGGVDQLSLRVSVESASFSLSYDAKRISAARIRETLNRGLAARGLSVSPMRTSAPG